MTKQAKSAKNSPLQVDSLNARTRKTTTPKNKKIDIQKALELRSKGLTEPEIAELFNCTKQAVNKALKPYAGLFDDGIEAFKKHRADLLALGQRELLLSVDPDDIKKMSVKDRVVAMGILYDKERLERGQSTSNHSIMARAVEAACSLEEG